MAKTFEPGHNVYTLAIVSRHYDATMRLIHDLTVDESRQIGDILYTNDFYNRRISVL